MPLYEGRVVENSLRVKDEFERGELRLDAMDGVEMEVMRRELDIRRAMRVGRTSIESLKMVFGWTIVVVLCMEESDVRYLRIENTIGCLDEEFDGLCRWMKRMKLKLGIK